MSNSEYAKKMAQLNAQRKAKRRFGDARDNNNEGLKIQSTMPARTRDGQTYPGGRALRRALRRLASARIGNDTKTGSRTMPGAMRP